MSDSANELPQFKELLLIKRWCEFQAQRIGKTADGHNGYLKGKRAAYMHVSHKIDLRINGYIEKVESGE
jgi:hypothetical protein